ncbi:MAG: ribokinase [Puniceicoccaceae bacterium]
MTEKPRICVIGSSNTDLVLNCDRLPNPGETIIGGELSTFQGGKGANQAVAAARAGAAVTFIGAIGNDDFGEKAKKSLASEGIDTSALRTFPGIPSGVAVIFLSNSTSENMIGVAKSANDLVSPSMIQEEGHRISSASLILCQLEIPMETVEAVADITAAKDIPFVLNPAPAKSLSLSLLRKVDILVPNETEACLLAENECPRNSARILVEQGCKAVVVTLGSKGALIADSKGLRTIPAPSVQPVDTVGAGDCFTAWLSTETAKGQSIDAAVTTAVRAASISVTRHGAQLGMPYLHEV